VAVEGDLIAGRYRLVVKVGRGAMGVVWRAHDELLDRIVAVKQLLAEAERSDGSLDVAVREARIAARLHHPNAITVHDVVVHDGRPCLVMEYLASRSLAALISSRGRLPVKHVVRIGGRMALALAAAHQAGIVHRDVKPENVLIGSGGEVKITDFGLSRAIGEGTLTRSGLIAGTPGFLAPEVARGWEAGYPSDVFSLGATLYMAIEGRPPFGDKDNMIALLMRSAGGEVEPPRYAGRFTSMLMSLLDPNPDARPTMRQVHEALLTRKVPAPVGPARPSGGDVGDALRVALDQRILSAGGTSAEEMESLDRGIAAWRRRKPIIVILAGVLVILGIVFGVMIAVADDDKKAQTVAAPPPPSTTRPANPNTTQSSPAGEPSTSTNDVCVSEVRDILPSTTGYVVSVQVRNLQHESLNGWRVTWTFPKNRPVKLVHGGALAQGVDESGIHVTIGSSATILPRAAGGFSFTVEGDKPSLGSMNMRCVLG
jgi:serine/threonine protein kinase